MLLFLHFLLSGKIVFDFWCLMPLSAIFQHGDSFSVEEAGVPGEPLTISKQLVNFITCGCKSSAPFFVIYKAGREPRPYW
jgi:hypothetical protein